MESLWKKKILLVDDETDWRVQVSDSLRQAGYDVLVAADASEAMLRVEQPGVGLIIVDDNLAGESGLLLTRFLHQNYPEKSTLLFTSEEYDDAKIRLMVDQGADRCVPKGNMDELIVTVGCYMT
jgi:DNA-binding response OmpR family regulator